MKAGRAFTILDEEGNNVEEFLRAQFAHIIRDRFPHIHEIISARLADAMLLRRKRILYRRSRYSKTPIRFQKKVTRHSAHANPISGHFTSKIGIGDPEVNTRVSLSTTNITQSQAATATTLATDGLRKASDPSIISVARTVALSDHEELVFPSPPVAYRKTRNKKNIEPSQTENNLNTTLSLDGEV
jgi:hypothetical protein